VLLPALAFQSSEAARQLPSLFDELGGLSAGISDFASRYGVPLTFGDQLLRPIEAIGPALVSNLVVVATGAATIVVQILLVIVVSLYLMLDGDRLGNYVLQAVPARYRDDFIYFVSSVYRAFGGFLRGQIIQSLVYGLGVGLIMLATGRPYVVFASVLAGLAIFIPFLGPVLGFLPTLFVALLTVSTGPGGAIASLVLTLVLNLLVMNVIAPKVMSESVGLHPILVLAAVLIGARLAGPWGALFGVPVAAVIATMVSFYRLTVTEREERVRELTQTPDPEEETQLPEAPDQAGVSVTRG
jgi:predicted PurR-regulated permease PerM